MSGAQQLLAFSMDHEMSTDFEDAINAHASKRIAGDAGRRQRRSGSASLIGHVGT